MSKIGRYVFDIFEEADKQAFIQETADYLNSMTREDCIEAIKNLIPHKVDSLSDGNITTILDILMPFEKHKIKASIALQNDAGLELLPF